MLGRWWRWRHAWVRGVAVLAWLACAWLAVWPEPDPVQRAFVLALMGCVLGTVLAASARPAFALLLAGAPFAALRVVSDVKLRLLDSALMPEDFVYYTRASLLETLRRYPHLYWLALGLAVGVPLLLALAWWLDRRLAPAARGWKPWAIRGAGTLACAIAFQWCLAASGPFASVHQRNAWQKMTDDAQLTNFFVNLSDSGVSLPDTAGDDVAAHDWSATAGGLPGTRPPPYPDIVQVLEESTFDPSIFQVCNVPACRVAMFRPDKHTRGHGFLRTHTFGGGTWVSEFAVESGLPQDIFGPGGMYAPFVLAPHLRDSLPDLLRRLGYATVAVYPTNGDFINARNAYQSYGFDHLYDAEELGLKEWEESDTQMFDAAKRVYDKVKKPGQPVFIMVLTLNQHGPHDEKPMKDLPRPFRDLLKGVSREVGLNFDTYLWQLHDSDVGMRHLEKLFLARKDPTVIVHFGDHQPSFNSLIRGLARTLPDELRSEQDFLTYYMVKTNFPGPQLPSYPALDIAYLPTMVIQAAGLPADGYFAAATALRDRCQGRFTDCPDKALMTSYYGWIFNKLDVYDE